MIEKDEGTRLMKCLSVATVALLLLTGRVWSDGNLEDERLFVVAKDKETSLAQALWTIATRTIFGWTQKSEG
jgi:hypothetical protein